MTFTFDHGFKEKHFNILLNYCKMTKIDPRVRYSEFHKKYHPYSRAQTTVDLINAAYAQEVLLDPVLYVNVGIEVAFMEKVADPLGLLKKCEKDKKIPLAYALYGHWSFIQFKFGANMLTFADSIIPHSYSNAEKYIENITFPEQKGKLPEDPYPHGWNEFHWDLYNVMRIPRLQTFRDVSKKVGLSWDTAKKYYYEILEQCKVHSSFFPLKKDGYGHQLLTFKTDYEISILKGLKNLDRTSYIYKANDTIILILFLIPRPFDFNISTNKFKELEEKGYIRDLHACTPRKWHNIF